MDCFLFFAQQIVHNSRLRFLAQITLHLSIVNIQIFVLPLFRCFASNSSKPILPWVYRTVKSTALTMDKTRPRSFLFEQTVLIFKRFKDFPFPRPFLAKEGCNSASNARAMTKQVNTFNIAMGSLKMIVSYRPRIKRWKVFEGGQELVSLW